MDRPSRAQARGAKELTRLNLDDFMPAPNGTGACVAL